jgi:hypothetical protein
VTSTALPPTRSGSVWDVARGTTSITRSISKPNISSMRGASVLGRVQLLEQPAALDVGHRFPSEKEPHRAWPRAGLRFTASFQCSETDGHGPSGRAVNGLVDSCLSNLAISKSISLRNSEPSASGLSRRASNLPLHGSKGGWSAIRSPTSRASGRSQQAGRLRSEWVADCRRNRWPDCVGISGRFPSEIRRLISVAAITSSVDVDDVIFLAKIET